MAIGEIYQMTTFYDNDDSEAQNVFTYEHVAGTDANPAEGLVDGWFNLVWPVLREAINSLCILTHIEAVNIMDPTDSDVRTGIGSAGLITVTASSQGATFDSFGVRYEKAYPSAPNGYKRFPGVAESLTSRNLYIVPQVDIDALLLQLVLAVSDPPNPATFFPVIVKRPYSFDVPPTVWYPTTTCTWTNLTTQNSRKERGL